MELLLSFRVLTWNLFHGRARPPAGRDLFEEYAAALAGWDWEVALLQEVPPWWASPLAQRSGADQRRVLTSRNALAPLRRAIAVRWPDLIKSNGGGANVILVRERRILKHRTARLCLWPERRWVHAVALAGGAWVANLHTGPYVDQGLRAAELLRWWSGGEVSALGGDFNVRPDRLEAPLSAPGYAYAGGSGTDLVFVSGFSAPGQVDILERGALSDHAPVLVSV